MTVLHEIACLNERGVDALLRCKTKHAISIFHTALNAVQNLLSNALVDRSDTSMNSIAAWGFSNELPALFDEKYYVFNSAVLFAPNPGDERISERSLLFSSAVILFNLGLAFHQLAITTDSKRPTSLIHAVMMYERSVSVFQILQEEYYLLGKLCIFQKLIWNNQGHVYFCSNDILNLQGMLNYLSTTHPQEMEVLQHILPGQDNLREIMLNVTLYQQLRIVCAGAA